MSNNGGPAFPCIPPCDSHGAIPSGYPFPDNGMTLRDYFAAKAMQGILSGPCSRDGVPIKEWLDVPTFAYQIAGAMILARAALSKAEGHIGQELAPDSERRVNGDANGGEK